MRFNHDETATVQAALLAISGEQQADAMLRNGTTPEAHADADQLTEAVIGAILALAKREKGSPLSEAELKHRRDTAYRAGGADDGSRGYSISCDGAVQAMAACLERAVEICGPRGYRVYNQSGQAVPVGSVMATLGQMSGFVGAAISRDILIGCGTA